MINLAPYRKAIVAGGAALFAALGASLTDGHLSLAEGCTAAAATFAAVGAVWRVPNARASAPRSRAKQ